MTYTLQMGSAQAQLHPGQPRILIGRDTSCGLVGTDGLEANSGFVGLHYMPPLARPMRPAIPLGPNFPPDICFIIF